MIRLASLFAVFFATQFASGYPVGAPITLEKMAEQADLVCKVVMESWEPLVDDKSFKKTYGFDPRKTQFRVVSTIQGKLETKTIYFTHYAPNDKGFGPYQPQFYKFDKGRSYILFAKKTDKPGVFTQLWQNHTTIEDLGVLRARGDDPTKGTSIQEVAWNEMGDLLSSDSTEDVIYAITKLQQMSQRTNDFERAKVFEVVEPLIRHESAKIALQAIGVLGCKNPHSSPGLAAFWLATIGEGHLPGLGTMEDRTKNVGGELYWTQLADVASSEAPADVRVAAIRALGLAKQPKLVERAKEWMDDTSAEVQQAAIILLSDYTDSLSVQDIRELAKSESPAVRIGVARAIGFGQMKQHVPMLGSLINDKDPEVSKAAAMNLLSFATKHGGMTLQANIDHPQYRSLFINALAREDASPYIDELIDVIKNNLRPKHWWGGWVPWGVSWDILFKHIQKQPAAIVRNGDFDKALDALESPNYYSSSEPRDLYALYLQRDMKDRAKEFRAACNKRITYNIDQSFDMVDKNPSTYQRK